MKEYSCNKIFKVVNIILFAIILYLLTKLIITKERCPKTEFIVGVIIALFLLIWMILISIDTFSVLYVDTEYILWEYFIFKKRIFWSDIIKIYNGKTNLIRYFQQGETLIIVDKIGKNIIINKNILKFKEIEAYINEKYHV